MDRERLLNDPQLRDVEEGAGLADKDMSKDPVRESHELSDWEGVRDHVGSEEGEEHERLLDPNLPRGDDIELHHVGSVRSVSLDSRVSGKLEEHEDSPYEEVRAAVRNFDEDLPCNTIRAWTIGLSLTIFGAGVNTLFSLRAPIIGVGPLVAQIIAWVMGRAWAAVVPDKQINLFGTKCDLNPGPFNMKEHAVVMVMASVAFGVAYATDVILAQLAFYKQDFGLVFQVLIVISSQSLGFGMAGILRKYLVYPAAMIWPTTLVAISLMSAMYETNVPKDPTVLGGNMPRSRWFFIVTAVSCLYYFLPGFLAQCLSVTAVATWVAPDNAVVNQLFGGSTGLSLLPITFDWTQVAGYIASPLVPPWHAIANTLIGVVVFFLGLASVLHYTGAWYSQFLPMSDASTYDNTGSAYNVTRVLNSEFTLDEEAYKAYSPLFLSTTFGLAYGLSFATMAALVVHTLLHYSGSIWAQYQDSTNEKPDIHMKLMRKYKEVPSLWYLTLFVLVLGMSLFAILYYPTNLTWWAFLLAITLAFVFSLPIGIILAVTGRELGLNVLTEFIFGYMQPGRPLALMLFKTYGYITMSQALNFIGDLKFGHYLKVPPRTLFKAQVVAVTVSCVVQVIVLNLALTNIDGICDVTHPQHFTCPGGRVFFSASVIWGLIGPARMFSPGQIYSGLLVFFAVGAVTPVVIYFVVKRYPLSPARFLMAPLIFGGAGAIPPATPLNYLSWGIVGYIFQVVVKKRHFRWWRRLNYLTSAGLDLGLAMGTIIVFFAFTIHNIDPPKWWGNSVVTTTLDYQGKAVQTVLQPGETFGPQVW
ncbi:OPT oligopeptide transporter protein-domain-containing protein [Poronia punctata]|nr:OPT oligopeptide transporter protein-domain-containing protein [Poronia punctata]